MSKGRDSVSLVRWRTAAAWRTAWGGRSATSMTTTTSPRTPARPGSGGDRRCGSALATPSRATGPTGPRPPHRLAGGHPARDLLALTQRQLVRRPAPLPGPDTIGQPDV